MTLSIHQVHHALARAEAVPFAGALTSSLHLLFSSAQMTASLAFGIFHVLEAGTFAADQGSIKHEIQKVQKFFFNHTLTSLFSMGESLANIVSLGMTSWLRYKGKQTSSKELIIIHTPIKAEVVKPRRDEITSICINWMNKKAKAFHESMGNNQLISGFGPLIVAPLHLAFSTVHAISAFALGIFLGIGAGAFNSQSLKKISETLITDHLPVSLYQMTASLVNTLTLGIVKPDLLNSADSIEKSGFSIIILHKELSKLESVPVIRAVISPFHAIVSSAQIVTGLALGIFHGLEAGLFLSNQTIETSANRLSHLFFIHADEGAYELGASISNIFTLGIRKRKTTKTQALQTKTKTYNEPSQLIEKDIERFKVSIQPKKIKTYKPANQNTNETLRLIDKAYETLGSAQNICIAGPMLAAPFYALLGSTHAVTAISTGLTCGIGAGLFNSSKLHKIESLLLIGQLPTIISQVAASALNFLSLGLFNHFAAHKRMSTNL